MTSPADDTPQSDGQQSDSDRHNAKMARKKQARDKIMASKTGEKGLIIVHTGKGKGKSSSAFGMVFRCIAHGLKTGVVQFIKGGWEPGEARALQAFGDQISWHALGEGFTWETQDRQRDQQLVTEAWQTALGHLRDERIKLVLLDELNVAIKLGYIEPDTVIAGLRERPELCHVAVTGRGAPASLIDAADLVTGMTLSKHPFREQGVKAQAGIEY